MATGGAKGSYPGMDQWRGKCAVVTGASSGIGYEVARQLAELGMNVVGCSRTITKIEELSSELQRKPTSGRLLAVKCDGRVEEDVAAVFEAARASFGGVGVCINNAGLSHNAPLLSGATAEWKDMLEVNILGVCVCSREFFKQLEERKVDNGHLILINSTAGHYVLPFTSIHFYIATKFALTAITEGLRQELRDKKSNVKVTAISPGLVRTEFFARMAKVDHDDMEQAKKDLGETLESEDVASAVVYALSTPSRMQIHDILIRHNQEN